MAPVRTAVSLPPCAADRVGPHAEPHPELENAGESARRRQTDHKSLQNSESGICLHQTNQTQDRLRSHETVGIERDRELVISAPSLAEIANVAGLVPRIHGAPPVCRPETVFPSRGELADARFFSLRNRRVTGIAQHIQVEAMRKT